MYSFPVKARTSGIFAGTLLAFLGGTSPAFGYQGAPVIHGGIVDGTVKVDGVLKPLPPLKPTKNKSHCAATIADPTHDGGSDGTLKNVEVFFKKIEKGKPLPASAPTLTNDACMFHPRVQGAVTGATITVDSADDIAHNTHLQFFVDGASLANFALPFKGFTVTKPLPTRSGLVRVKCDIHEWMRAWVWVFDHPYFATTDDQGHFSIDDVPPGQYTVVAWHEELGQTELPVTVAAGKTTTLEFHFTAKK